MDLDIIGKMDVLYVVGDGSNWNNNELRYSLRSIAKHGIGLGRVFIIGSIPYFVNQDKVTCISFADDPAGTPANNVFRKIRFAIENVKELSNPFLLSSDDHFFVRPTDFGNYPIFHKGASMPIKKEDINSGRFGDARYTTTMVETAKLMKKYKLDTHYFEGHTNKLYDKDAWQYLCDIGFFKEAEKVTGGISTNAPMAAAYLKLHPDVKPEYRKDIKIGSFKDQEELLRQIGTSNSFSIRDAAITSGIGGYLNTLFPDKCDFEKEDIVTAYTDNTRKRHHMKQRQVCKGAGVYLYETIYE